LYPSTSTSSAGWGRNASFTACSISFVNSVNKNHPKRPHNCLHQIL
jgi:hypothetical protein